MSLEPISKINKFRFSKQVTPYLFILPVVIVFLLIILYPLAKNIWMSFFQNYLARPLDHDWNNFKNYADLFGDRIFWKSTKVTGIYISITVVIRFFLGFLISLLLNQKLHLRGLARALIIIPWAIPDIVACLVWIQMFDFQYGIINYFLMNMHLIKEPLDWLSSISQSLPAAMIVNVWKGTPWVAIMLLAGLQSIPEDLYEAAEMDGASNWQKLLNVTIPLLRPVIVTVFLLLVIWSIKDFAIIYILNRGGPVHATEVMTIYIYQKAFTDLKMGVAAAGGVVLLLASMVFTVLYLKFLDREEGVW
jgi:multiple sugar transport system permease protein